MKKLFLLAILAAFVFVGCSDDTTGTTPGDGSSAAPETYTQKSFLEYFSGTWCPYCPDGKVYFENIRAKVGENFSSAVYHRTSTYADYMDNIYDDAIDAKYAAGYPTGMVNRVGGVAVSRSGWEATVNQVLAQEAKCGLAIDASNKNGTTLDIAVKLGIGKEDMPAGNYFLTVLIIEDVVDQTGTGYDQRNAYNTTSGHPYFGKGDPIVGYEHTNVVRNVLTAALGDELTADQVKGGTLSTFNFTADVAGIGDDLDVVAFISEATTNLANPAASTSFMYNVQRTDMGTNQDFD
ncbi:MAG: Omp28-related outer membrane protein [Bacteroidia bacterium]|nr:Omp28-related outer membrane protein [Bacteroidia bacterium]